MLICNDFANDLTDGIASPAFNSPLIIAALICDAICSYKGRLALLLTTISKFPPPFRSLVLCCYKYSIKRKSTDVKRVNYKKQAKRLCSVCFLQFIWTWNSVWLSFKFVCYFMAHEHLSLVYHVPSSFPPWGSWVSVFLYVPALGSFHS